jgi:multicomponent Na+:H+ antiporter subunit A
VLALLALHAVLGLTLIAFGSRLGRRAVALGVLGPAAALLWLATRLPGVVDGDVVEQHVEWVPQIGLAIDLRLDGFAALMVLLVAGIGVLVFAYGTQYFDPRAVDVGRLAGLLVLFAGAMLGVVLADDLLLLYVCWELTSVTSYLLIGNRHEQARARAAGLQALLVTSAGGLAMLAGFVLLGQEAGTFRLSAILASPPAGTVVSVAILLVLLGAFTKSAQYPFHSWLPGAMVAPTPVSAYLHSATMVKAGVYLIARFAPVFVVVGFWRPLVLGVGVLTMVAGGLRALRQHDLKLLLAFGTISQLGLLVVVFGAGTAAATTAGCVLLLAHALFKAALFLVVGIVEHQTGTRDLRRLPALGPRWRPVAIVSLVSAASMAGLPLLIGFVAKEADYEAYVEAPFPGRGLVLVALVVGGALTAAYSARFCWGLLVEPGRRARAEQAAGEEVDVPVAPAPAWAFVAPAAVLAAVTVLLGVVPGLADGLMTAAAQSLHVRAGEVHLAIWHGFNEALLLSSVSLLAGGLLFWARAPVSDLLAVGRDLPKAADVYLALLRGLNALARRVTAVVQNGSLPVYAGTILLTVAVLPTGALLLGEARPGDLELWATPTQVPAVGIVLGGALAAATIRRRFSAVLFLGVAGYGMAALFVVQGAPDLALTQVVVETLSTVLFVLVLRRLPDRFVRTSTTRRRAGRVAVSVAVGLSVFWFALVAGGPDPEPAVSDAMVAKALPEGYGHNVVNVILVDFRALDTLGEITVLATVAIGVVALARAGRRRRSPDEAAGAPTAEVAS